jgi:hypothetical protein
MGEDAFIPPPPTKIKYALDKPAPRRFVPTSEVMEILGIVPRQRARATIKREFGQYLAGPDRSTRLSYDELKAKYGDWGPRGAKSERRFT